MNICKAVFILRNEVEIPLIVIGDGGKYKQQVKDFIKQNRLEKKVIFLSEQPSVRLHGRAAARAEQLGMDRIALSITHESDYAVAIAFGVRTTGGRYVFPPDIEDRLDDRERRLLARMERLRELHEANAALEATVPPSDPDRPEGTHR